MKKFIISFKLNLLSFLFFWITLPFYLIIFIKSNINIESKMFGLLIFLPILFIQIASIIISSIIKFTNKNPKILLIFMVILFFISVIVILFAKKYFAKYLVDNNYRTDNKIYKNTILNIVYFFACILFAIIYTILDLKLKPNQQEIAEFFSMLFVASIIFVVFEYILMLFFIVYSVDLTPKQKLICCIPFLNIFYIKKIITKTTKIATTNIKNNNVS